MRKWVLVVMVMVEDGIRLSMIRVCFFFLFILWSVGVMSEDWANMVDMCRFSFCF